MAAMAAMVPTALYHLGLKYKFLNDGMHMVAASDTFDGKLFHNTAPQ